MYSQWDALDENCSSQTYGQLWRNTMSVFQNCCFILAFLHWVMDKIHWVPRTASSSRLILREEKQASRLAAIPPRLEAIGRLEAVATRLDAIPIRLGIEHIIRRCWGTADTILLSLRDGLRQPWRSVDSGWEDKAGSDTSTVIYILRSSWLMLSLNQTRCNG